MLYSIISFLLDVVSGLVGGAFLLRLYMQIVRAPFANPLGQFVLALSNWLVLPLRRLLPFKSGWDIASLAAAYLIELAQFGLLWLLAGMGAGATALPILAGFGVVRLAISGLTGLIMVYAILSWVQARSPMLDVIERLCAPPLRPIRRWVPLVGGVDLSPLVLLVLLQISAMVLTYLQASLLR